MRRMVKRMSGGAGPATTSVAARKGTRSAIGCTNETRSGTATTAGAAENEGFADSNDTVALAQCFSHRPPSPISAFICAMAIGSATGPEQA